MSVDKERAEQLFHIVWDKYITRSGGKELLKWIEETDFFRAPASRQYHLAVAGGLCKHSLNVYKRLKKLLQNEYGDSCMISAKRTCTRRAGRIRRPTIRRRWPLPWDMA